MTRFDMMEKISNTLTDGEVVTVNVALKGKYNHVDVYEITNKSVTYIGHKWTRYSDGSLRATYRNRVVNR